MGFPPFVTRGDTDIYIMDAPPTLTEVLVHAGYGYDDSERTNAWVDTHPRR